VGADDTTEIDIDTDTDPEAASDNETAVPAPTTSADLDRLIEDVEDVLRSAPAPVEPSPPVVRRKPSWQARKLGYQPGLDGLRALAVGLVVAYHLGYSRVAGGYIGVELFFVLSGWLVCALLVNEHQRTDGIALRDFWVRRARRLLPALGAVVVGTLAWASVAQPTRLAELRSEAVAAVGYHLNWRLIADHKSYFQTAAGPSALNHLWSLSIEEQFYLVFPLLCGLVLVRVGRKPAVAVALAGAVAATVLRFALASGGGDPTRLYFGTDTRAAGLLAGVALGLFWTPNRLRPHAGRMFVAALDAVAATAAVVVGWYAFTLTDRDGAAFRYGLTAVELATLALIAVAVYPAPTYTARLLAASPLRWVGQRSYGIYLIHWPVIVFTAAAPGEQPESPLKVAAQVAIVLGLAALSYRLIEQPVRHRGFGDAGRDALARVGRITQGRPLAGLATVAGVVLVLGLAAGVGHDVMTAATPEAAQPAQVRITATATTVPATTTTVAPAAAPATTVPATTVPAPAPAAPPGVPPGGFTAIGDSVLVGAGPALSARLGGGVTIDAAIGRQMSEAVDVVHNLDAQGLLGHVVLLHLGNNGPFSASQIDEVLAAIGPDRVVMLVNVEVPRRWEGDVNNQLEAAVARHPNARLVDWWSLVTSESGLTREDGYHLTAAGAERFTDLVVGQIPMA
jgi:peptidoglycan/LPS O-acetylase OafA/YrhL